MTRNDTKEKMIATIQGQNVCKTHGDHLYSRCKCGHLYCMRYWKHCPRCAESNATNRS